MQNRDIWIRIKSLYGSQPSSVVFLLKTATLAPELQVSMGPSPPLWFGAFTTATLWPELIVSMRPSPHLSFCACKTAWLAPELLVSMGLSPHLLFLHSKQRLLDQNCKSLCVTALICGFCIENSDFSTRIASLYGSQPSSVVFTIKTARLGPELKVSMGSRPHLWLFAFKKRL